MFGTAQPALLAFPEERPVFLREYSTNHYGVLPYFLSRLTMELFITAAQIFVQVVITYFMVGFQGSFGMFYLTTYTLAMASTALAVLLGRFACFGQLMFFGTLAPTVTSSHPLFCFCF